MDSRYQYIKQHQYLIDGIPAGKFGEWPGIKSNHWNSSKRIIHPIESKKIVDDGVIELEKNRRHFKEKYGTEKVERINKKRIFSAFNDIFSEKRPIGLKKIKFEPIFTKIDYEKRHFQPFSGNERTPFYQGIKTFYQAYKDNQKNKENNEFSVENQMGKKQRIWSTDQMRNYMPMRTLGDKSYKKCEELPYFFTEGGLIPGSTNVTNFNKTLSRKAYNFYETLDLTKRLLNRDKIYKNKINKEIFDYEKNYVENSISKWEINILKEFDPNYLKKNKDKNIINEDVILKKKSKKDILTIAKNKKKSKK